MSMLRRPLVDHIPDRIARVGRLFTGVYISMDSHYSTRKQVKALDIDSAQKDGVLGSQANTLQNYPNLEMPTRGAAGWGVPL